MENLLDILRQNLSKGADPQNLNAYLQIRKYIDSVLINTSSKNDQENYQHLVKGFLDLKDFLHKLILESDIKANAYKELYEQVVNVNKKPEAANQKKEDYLEDPKKQEIESDNVLKD